MCHLPSFGALCVCTQAQWQVVQRACEREALPATLPDQAHAPACTGTVAVISAGTADEAVAEECRATADAMGCYCFRLPDVSVDGLHRILHNLPGGGALPPFCCLPRTNTPGMLRSCAGRPLLHAACACVAQTARGGALQWRSGAGGAPRQEPCIAPCPHGHGCTRGWVTELLWWHAAVRAADVVVVAMGNDGALASVVAGLVEAPVIAVPTSVGYGAALQVPRTLCERGS